MQLQSIAQQATRSPAMVVNNVFHVLDREFLLAASRQTRTSSAPGGDQVTAQQDAGVFAAASQAGFHGWVLKDGSVSQLVGSIRGVLEGRIALPPRSAQRAGKVQSPAERDAALLAQHLTRREREVLSLLVEGESSQSISHSLSLSPHTVRTHIQNILTKLGVHSRFEAASFAVRFALALERGEGAA